MADSPTPVIVLADKLVATVPTALEQLGAHVTNAPQYTSADLESEIADANILVVRSTKVTRQALESAKELSLVVRAGAGVNTIDVAAASALGIQVANCPGINAAAVAELAVGLLISADRRIVDACSDLRQGKWRKKEYGQSRGLKGRTLGILGFGAIGKAVAQAGKGLGMHPLVWSRSMNDQAAKSHGVERAADPLELAARSDAVSVHLALTPETQHTVNDEFLSAMRDGGILVNTSRGELVDTAALRRAIEIKKLRVGLDVFENEPSGGEATMEDTGLAAILTGTPHIGASTDQTSEAIGAEVVNIVRDFLDTGRAQSAVNLSASSESGNTLVVRHYNRVGVLASVLDALRLENINVEQMQNTIFRDGKAALCSLGLDRRPTEETLGKLSELDAVLNLAMRSE